MKQQHSFLYRNGLSIVFFGILLICWIGQAYTGWLQFNKELEEKGMEPLRFGPYLGSPHFFEATFENWESEFLQMGMYVILTVILRQKGSAESKDLDKKEAVDREPKPGKDAPWPVNKGGWWLRLYKHSLSLAFFFLFAVSFVLHFIGSRGTYNIEQLAAHEPPASVSEYLLNSKFWFESFQNWQSEFLAVGSIIVLSIFLRQWGSPESKPVDAPHSETGK
ncbi:hypothetical protein EGT74_06085 [Chitinophaga lutea]|uniref:Uncharacterized protein n=1 Tax=Chitinophaga lutea TaxID=2488634 RepID=A0A3N4Q6E0_9BACT|nr:DUF6766 family protein [Chitinophaga lutea]RPE13101.1 hypothetical protein EGT74_06085 [Chitinophaga lutea]